jgi:glycosyltransferase involved in cell wall biosynthesis
MASSPLVIIPAYNEARFVGETVGRVLAAGNYTVLVIDDGSVDETREVALAAGALVASHPFNLGYGAALQTGYKYALANDYDLLVQLDADGQHDPVWIGDLIAPVVAGKADLSIGSRFKKPSRYQMDPARSAGRRLFRLLLKWFGGPTIEDPTSGLQALSRRVFTFYSEDFFPFDFPDIDVLLLAHKRGFRIEEIPVEMNPSPEGRKPMHTGLTTIYYPYKMLLSTFRNWRLG